MHQSARRLLDAAARALAVALLLLLACAAPVRAQFPAAEVVQLQAERLDDGVYVSAAVRFELPPVVEDALAKGIPMHFVAEASIFRDRWYWYDKRVKTVTRHMRLAYQPLTRRWRVQVSSSPIGHSGLALGQNFDTREEAVAVLQRISRWRIADLTDVDPEVGHTVDFRFRLDISQLPRPFQIGVVGQSEWNLVAARSQRLDHFK